jgi:mannose-1-phosphate guanylyltransferase/phosphomannomutase
MEAATGDDIVFAGSLGGGYIFPEFLPAYDSVMSFGKLLELLASRAETVSQLVAAIPSSTLVHKTVTCPWSLKGTVMRTVTEDLQRSDDGRISLLDGVKLWVGEAWAQVLPDADEPVFHIYAEGADAAESEALADRFAGEVRAVIEQRAE